MSISAYSESASRSTSDESSRAITVPFHGCDLYVVEHEAQPYTPMKPIITGMGLTWHGQHAKIKTNSRRWGVLELRIPSAGGLQDMLCMPLRKLPGWLSGIESGKVKNDEARAKVLAFQNECDDVLWQYWNEGLAVNPRAAYSVSPNQTITEEQAETLRLMLTTAVERLPKHKQAAFMRQAWGKLKAHYKVSYRQIPFHEFSEAVSIVARHSCEWELVDDTDTKTINEQVSRWVQQLESGGGTPVELFRPLFDVLRRKLGKDLVECPNSKLIVDRQKLAAIWVDLGRLKSRVNGLGILESDLPPAWWQSNAISMEA